jgi:hypothetical protein
MNKPITMKSISGECLSLKASVFGQGKSQCLYVGALVDEDWSLLAVVISRHKELYRGQNLATAIRIYNEELTKL